MAVAIQNTVVSTDVAPAISIDLTLDFYRKVVYKHVRRKETYINRCSFLDFQSRLVRL